MKLEDIQLEESEQPDVIEFHLANHVFIKSGLFKRKGRVIPQHSHEDDHISFIATGSVKAWVDGEYLGVFKAPCSIKIERHKMHTFLTEEDNTTILCIHNLALNGMVELHDLHELTFP